MNARSTGRQAAAPGPSRKPPRGRREPRLIDRIVDYPYRKLFGLRGQLVIASVILIGLSAKFVIGINTVSLDPMTCELAWTDAVYRPFHKDRILANTQRKLTALLVETQTELWQVNAGRNPFGSTGGGNVVGADKINTDKFFWRAYAENLKKKRIAVSNCLGRLPTYTFD